MRQDSVQSSLIPTAESALTSHQRYQQTHPVTPNDLDDSCALKVGNGPYEMHRGWASDFIAGHRFLDVFGLENPTNPELVLKNASPTPPPELTKMRDILTGLTKRFYMVLCNSWLVGSPKNGEHHT